MSFFRHTHKAPVGWFGGTPYGALQYRGTDGMGVVHAAVVVKCATCAKPFDLVMFHTTDAAFSTHEEQAFAIERVLNERAAK